MSVYKKGRFWHYDFQYKGRRYHGSTGQESKRAAETVERKRRLEAATGSYSDAGEMTIQEAANRYWEEKAQFGRAAKHTKRQLQVMMTCVGPNLRLKEIDAPDVMSAITKRRGLDLGRGKPSPTTVNRDMIDCTLRPLLNRARKVWKAKQLPEIDWSELRSNEPKGESREYTAAQEEAWKAQLEPVPRFALHLLLTYGLRFGELLMRPSAIDGERAVLTIEGKYRKNETVLTIPLMHEDARTLAAMAGRADALGFETILHHGEPPVCLDYGKLYYAIRKGAKRAGLTMPRIIHGARHHAATQVLRKTGNLKMAQRLLGHASITSTTRYAHVSDDDLRHAIDGLSRNSPEAKPDTTNKPMKRKDNSDV